MNNSSLRSNNYTSNIRFSFRSALTVYSISDSHLLSVTNLTEGKAQKIQPEYLLKLLGSWFDEYKNDSTVGMLVNWVNANLAGGNNTSNVYFLELLTLPILTMNTNGIVNFSSALHPTPNLRRPNLESSLYVPVSLGRSHIQVVVAKWTVITYIVLSVAVFLWSIAGLIWAMFHQGPNNSGFPLIDFGSRIASSQNKEHSASKLLAQCASGKGLLKKLGGALLFHGDVEHYEYDDISERSKINSDLELSDEEKENLPGKIGFSLCKDDVRQLREGDIYE